MSSLKEQMHKNLYRSYFRGQRSDYTDDDIVEMLDALVKENWSKKEEMLRWYNTFKSGERPGYKEAAEKIKKELENFQE